MSSPSKATAANNAFTASTRTDEGMPLDPRLGAALATADLGDGGPARRVDCRPPQLLAAPSLHIHTPKGPPQLLSAPSIQTFAPKTPPSEVWQPVSLVAGPIDDSLMDDDDELVDYFGSSSIHSAPLTSPDLTVADGVASPSTTRWNVREHNVRALPPFHPLEKSAAFVPQASASVLAARITTVLQSRSIKASYYDAQNAKVDCVSKSHVEFRVRLYRGRGENSHDIIVEVQRRAGFDLNYASDVNAIFNAVEGKDTKECLGGIAPTYYEDTEDMESAEKSGGMEALQVISDILCPNNTVAAEVTVEGRDLAMASLASLTNLDHIGQAAVQLSNELLTSQTHADLRRVVFSQARQDPKQSSQSLEILANVANCSHNPSPLLDLLSQNYHLLGNLVSNIEEAPIDPHTADLSCRILLHIYVSREMVENLIPQEYVERLVAGLVGAVCCGGECHAELQGHSRHLLERIV